MAFNPPSQKEPPKVRDGDALVLLAEVHPDATLPQVIQASLRVARNTGCSVRSTWNTVPVVVSPEDTYQGAQRRVNEELKA